MATTLNSVLPGGWTKLSGGPMFDITRTGRPGRWHINQNDPFAIWELSVSYVREQYEEATDKRFDDIYRFFLNAAGAFAFLVDDVFDNRHDSLGGYGTVELINGVLRLGRRFQMGGTSYLHPVTRPKADVILSGGGVLDPNTGIVTGGAPGTWTGGFWRPMIMMNAKLTYETDPSGIVKSIDVPLQENLEI